MKLDHVGIVVGKIDSEILDFYTNVLGCENAQFMQLSNEYYDLRACFLSLGDVKIELLEGRKGPEAEFTQRHGAGAIFEIALQVESLEELYDRMKKRGITLVATANNDPLPYGKKYNEAPGAPDKWAYLPRDKTFGTIIEIVEKPQ